MSKPSSSSAGGSTSTSRSTSTGSAGSKVRSGPGSGSAGASRTTPKTTPKKVSDRLNPKTVDPFSASPKKSSAFSTLYNSGGVPCRLIHGSVKHKLAWNPIPEDVPLDPVLITLAEGLRETVHPYMFVARVGFKELLEVRGIEASTIQLLPKLVPPIRAALTHTDASVFDSALVALVQLSYVTGPSLGPHLKTLLVSVAKRSMDKKHKDLVMRSLQQLEENGGREALLHIKARIPTYQSVGT